MPPSIEAASVPLDQGNFLRQLLRHLAGSLQDLIGMHEAESFISIAGQSIGDEIDLEYRKALQVEKLSKNQVTEVMVDLKQRIGGDFFLISESEDQIVLGNTACPFGNNVKDRPALCMMTSNVFGVITAENLGYARVSIDESIARGDTNCRVTVALKPEDSGLGREYFATLA